MEANLVAGVIFRCSHAVKAVPQATRLLAGLTAVIFLWCAVLLPAIGQAASNNAQAEIELGEKISKEVEKDSLMALETHPLKILIKIDSTTDGTKGK